jgi:hypothetical protein
MNTFLPSSSATHSINNQINNKFSSGSSFFTSLFSIQQLILLNKQINAFLSLKTKQTQKKQSPLNLNNNPKWSSQSLLLSPLSALLPLLPLRSVTLLLSVRRTWANVMLLLHPVTLLAMMLARTPMCNALTLPPAGGSDLRSDPRSVILLLSAQWTWAIVMPLLHPVMLLAMMLARTPMTNALTLPPAGGSDLRSVTPLLSVRPTWAIVMPLLHPVILLATGLATKLTSTASTTTPAGGKRGPVAEKGF